MLSGKINYTVP